MVKLSSLVEMAVVVVSSFAVQTQQLKQLMTWG